MHSRPFALLPSIALLASGSATASGPGSAFVTVEDATVQTTHAVRGALR